jgi:hypothetical protein
LAKDLFLSYDEYLALIDNNVKRAHLRDKVSFDQAYSDEVFLEMRGISRRFTDALERLFFDDERLKLLTRKYGLF